MYGLSHISAYKKIVRLKSQETCEATCLGCHLDMHTLLKLKFDYTKFDIDPMLAQYCSTIY